MSKANAARAVVIDGKVFERKPGGKLAPLADRTDYRRLDRMSARQTGRAALADSEGLPMSDEEWLKGAIETPKKIPVGIKLDEDVVRWFKAQGRGYQTRINTVLQRYVASQRKAG